MKKNKKVTKNKKALSKNQYSDMLDDICAEDCPSGKYCILKMFLLSAHPDPRILIQMKCVEKHKDAEMSWGEAWTSWIEGGYSEKFAEVYDEGLSYTKIYKEIMKDE
jgi:hypothetical protein